MIDSYKFGQIVIDGRRYDSDLIIYPDHIDSKWWRKEGHLLKKSDLVDIVKFKPDILIIGTGNPGLLKVTDETVHYIKSKEISLIVEKTENACKIYNKLKENKIIIAALHLTC